MALQSFPYWRSCKRFVKDWLSVLKWGICYAFILNIRHNNFIWDIKDDAKAASKSYKTAHQQNDCLNLKIYVIIKLNTVLHTHKRHWVSICRRKNRAPCTKKKKNSKWINHLNMKSETMKLIEENIGSTLHDTGVWKGSLASTPFNQELKQQLSSGTS